MHAYGDWAQAARRGAVLPTTQLQCLGLLPGSWAICSWQCLAVAVAQLRHMHLACTTLAAYKVCAGMHADGMAACLQPHSRYTQTSRWEPSCCDQAVLSSDDTLGSDPVVATTCVLHDHCSIRHMHMPRQMRKLHHNRQSSHISAKQQSNRSPHAVA